MTSFILNNKELKDVLSVLGTIAGKNKSLPVLDNVLIDVDTDSNKVYVKSTDLSNTLNLNIPITNVSGDNISILVNHKDISSIVSSFDKESVNIIYEDEQITLEYTESTFNLLALDNSQEENVFPEIELDKSFGEMSISLLSFLHNISLCKPFISDDPLRPIMNCVHIYSDNNKCVFEGTDANKVRRIEVDGTVNGVMNSLIPESSINVLEKLLKTYSDYDDDNAKINRYNKKTVIKTDLYELVITEIEGKFPNVLSVIPDISEHYYMRFDLDQFVKTISRIVKASNQSTNMIVFDFNSFGVDIHTEDLDRSISAKANISVGSDDISTKQTSIGLNGKKLLGLLNSTSGERITMYMHEPSKAVVFNVDGNNNDTLLIMPLLIKK